MAWALPLTGSSGMPSAGQNMRDSVDSSSALDPRFSANTKKPSVPSSVPIDDQGVEVRRERIQGARIADRHEQPGAALARDARGHDLVQLSCRQAQRFGDA